MNNVIIVNMPVVLEGPASKDEMLADFIKWIRTRKDVRMNDTEIVFNEGISVVSEHTIER